MQRSGKRYSRVWEQNIQKSCGRNECVEEFFEAQCNWSTQKGGETGEIMNVGNKSLLESIGVF